MSSKEIEQVVAQRVANVIEAIAIYESKIRMAHDSMNQVIHEEATVATKGNGEVITVGILTNNKARGLKWLEHTLLGQATRRLGHTIKNYRTSAPAKIKRAPVANQKPAVSCFGCGAQGHFKSKCPRLKNQNHDNQKGKEEKTRKNSKTVKDFTYA
ncbi:reverse transcriptase domain-containing protein [Tanacetum coccineum]